MRTFSKDERGTAVVEFALMLPIIFLILAAIFDYSIRFQRTSMINNAAQIAARDVAIHHDSGVQSASAKAAAVAAGVPTGATFAIPTTCTPGNSVTVTIDATYDTVGYGFFGSTFVAHGQGVAQCAN